MHKIFTDATNISETQIHLSDANHIKALRLKVGDELIICDGNYNDYFCSIISINKNDFLLRINTINKSSTESSQRVILFQCIPKADKFEYIVQKAIELGVYEIYPVISSFCDNKTGYSDNKMQRIRKIAMSASEQCGRGIIPYVNDFITFAMAIDLAKAYDIKLVAYEKSILPLKTHIEKLDMKQQNTIGIIIGAEGGFSQSEIDLCTSNGIINVSLGKRILRTETASVMLLSVLSYENT